jgi:hypothetical protein
MLLKNKYKIPFTNKQEEEILIKGMSRSYPFYVVGIPKEFFKKYGKKINIIVDNKYLELFSSSILSSLITIGIAAAAEGITSSGNVQTTETAGGSTLNSGGVKDYAVLDAVTGVTDLTKNVLKERLGVKKTITINQGERIKVFVNKDIIFPSNPYTSNTNIFR